VANATIQHVQQKEQYITKSLYVDKMFCYYFELQSCELYAWHLLWGTFFLGLEGKCVGVQFVFCLRAVHCKVVQFFVHFQNMEWLVQIC